MRGILFIGISNQVNFEYFNFGGIGLKKVANYSTLKLVFPKTEFNAVLGNILINDMKHPSNLVLSDFGLCKIFPDQYTHKTSEKCGTMSYMSPEQLKRELYGKPVDLFAVAITTYIMIVGKHPF